MCLNVERYYIHIPQGYYQLQQTQHLLVSFIYNLYSQSHTQDQHEYQYHLRLKFNMNINIYNHSPLSLLLVQVVAIVVGSTRRHYCRYKFKVFLCNMLLLLESNSRLLENNLMCYCYNLLIKVNLLIIICIFSAIVYWLYILIFMLNFSLR